jgi:hypothetical protein
LGRSLAIHEALKFRPVAWVAPTYKYLLPQWREVCDVLAPVIVSKSEEEKHLRIRGGGELDFWSADGGTPGEGRRYSLAIFDECAMMGADLEKLWTRSLRPTLADFQGSAWFLSTSKGANAYFNTLFSYGQGEREDWKSWQLGTIDNPFIPPAEVESARRDLPAAAFAQEFLGDAVSFSGTVFTNLDSAIVHEPIYREEYLRSSSRPWMRNVQIFIGCDWAGAGRRAGGDWTAFVVIAFDNLWASSRRSRTATVVQIERLKTSFALARQRLQGLVAQYSPAGILAETNSIGAPQVEALRAAGLHIQGWTATNATKHRLVENLALAFENGQIKIPDIPNRTELLAELMAYEAIPLQNGMTRFSAPPGAHDDLTQGLMLAHWAGTMPCGGPRSAWIA